MNHVLPPTIFFLFGFNLILFTRWMTLQEHGIPFTNFFVASLAALLVGKAVLVVDNLRFMHRFGIAAKRTTSVVGHTTERSPFSTILRSAIRSHPTLSVRSNYGGDI